MNPFLRALALPTLISFPFAAAAQPSPTSFHHEQVMGTSLDIKVVTASPSSASLAESAALAEIDRLSALLSTYQPDSAMSRWLASPPGQPTSVPAELLSLLSLFDTWHHRTSGALNPAAAAASALWLHAEKSQSLPSPASLAATATDAARTHWSLNLANSTATRLDHTPLAFNSLAKSHILSMAADAAMNAAHPHSLVLNCGGDIIVRGQLPETISIANPLAHAENAAPLDTIAVSNAAVATSGNYRRGFTILGHHYSHIIDPRSSRPADAVASATVVTSNAAAAGAMATAFCILSPAESAALAASHHHTEFLIVLANGQRFHSNGWAALHPDIPVLADTTPPTPPTPPADSATPPKPAPDAPPATPSNPTPAPTPTSDLWDDTTELAINLELKRPGNNRYRRPYVAVWIEDKDKQPVRTIALWHGKPRWLPDLRAWSKSDRLRRTTDDTPLPPSITGATRAAGQYKLSWDGRNSLGKPVKRGTYTVFIEVVREHGTYQLMKKEIDLSNAPAQAKFDANTEVSAASLDFHRKPTP